MLMMLNIILCARADLPRGPLYALIRYAMFTLMPALRRRFAAAAFRCFTRFII